jgi:hypothetical protein
VNAALGGARPVPRVVRWMLTLGIVASLAANLARGWSQGLIGTVVAVSLVESYELLAWMVRTAATGEQRAFLHHVHEAYAALAAVDPSLHAVDITGLDIDQAHAAVIVALTSPAATTSGPLTAA